MSTRITLSRALGPDASPGDVVCALAQAKAERVAGELDSAVAADCVVIGCDSMLYIDGRLCGKPQSVAAAANSGSRSQAAPGSSIPATA